MKAAAPPKPKLGNRLKFPLGNIIMVGGKPFCTAPATAWSPSALTNLEQWLEGAVSGPWMLDTSQTGDERILNGGPGLQRGRCVTLNGSTQYISTALSGLTAFTAIARAKWTSSAHHNIFSGGTSGNSITQYMEVDYNAIWYTGSQWLRGTSWLHNTGWRSVAYLWDSADDSVAIAVDGSIEASATDSTYTAPTATFSMIGANILNVRYFGGDIMDVRIYSRKLTEEELLYIHTFGASGTDPGVSDLKLWYRFDEQSGSTAYDSSGQGHHGTYINSPTHSTQDLYSWQNSVGYSKSGSVFIPRDEANPTLDVLGNPLDYSGSAPRHARLQSPCGTFDGTNDYATTGVTPPTTGSIEAVFYWNGGGGMILGCNDASANRCYFGVNSSRIAAGIGSQSWNTIIGTTTLTAGVWYKAKVTWDGSTVELYLAEAGQSYGAPEYSAAQSGSIPTSQPLFMGANSSSGTPGNYFNGRLAEVSLSTTHRWVLCQNDGTTLHNVKTNADHATLLNASLPSFWGNTENVLAYAANNGYRLSGSTIIPALEDGSSAADGNPLTHTAGFNGSATLDHNPFSIPALTSNNLNGMTLPSARALGDPAVTADQYFFRGSATKEDRFLITSQPLTGADLSNAQTYTQ